MWTWGATPISTADRRLPHRRVSPRDPRKAPGSHQPPASRPSTFPSGHRPFADPQLEVLVADRLELHRCVPAADPLRRVQHPGHVGQPEAQQFRRHQRQGRARQGRGQDGPVHEHHALHHAADSVWIGFTIARRRHGILDCPVRVQPDHRLLAHHPLPQDLRGGG